MNDVEQKALAELEAQTRKLEAETAALAKTVEKSREQTGQTAREVYEFALDNYHGEQGYRRIKDFADANGISFREAMIAIGNELHPKPPEPIKVHHPLTEAKIEAHMAQTGLSYRDALLELSEQGYVLDHGEETSTRRQL